MEEPLPLDRQPLTAHASNLIVGLGEILLRDSDQGVSPLPLTARNDIERLNANAQDLGC